ncbi:MAG: cryptochrome/photolyase family protein [Myxococcota bacterium]|nr:cryptochrome/photolyase family protein [Myxococcota bacterium]
MTRPAYFVGPCDLDRRLACVPAHPDDGTVLLVESVAKGSALPWNRKKLVLVLSAMRHFAEELRADGFDVEIRRAPTYVEGIRRHVAERNSSRVIALLPRDHGLEQSLRAADVGVPVELHDDGGPGGHFLLPRADFARWAEGRKTLRMDTFYRWMRRRLDVLLEDGKPEGGRWSFDADNRKPAKGARPPALPLFPPDALTQQVMAEVDGWSTGWGETAGFGWPVTRAQALHALERFIDERLCDFGDFQDAMVEGESFLWHACLSPAVNLGLLHPRELLEAALAAYARGAAPINAVEGFIRQVVGWREFIRGVYHHRMPDLRSANRFDAEAPLPALYWDPDRTDMACVRDAVRSVRDHGYAHHIQRLMVLGNLGLLLGVQPHALSHWFWAGFVDAHEWVELPNVIGMALAADPTFTTKPYAASGAYIHKMSNHCRGCRSNVKARVGDDACPFNALFWDFMARHRDDLGRNPRLGMLLRTWDRWDADQQAAIRARAAAVQAALQPAASDPVYGAWTFHDDAG